MPRAVVHALAFAFAVVILGSGTGHAQQAEVNEVKAAIDAYHAALGSLDIAKMEPLWSHDANVMLINPRDKSISVGWDAVRKHWVEATFNLFSELAATQVDGPHIVVNGNVAWSTGIVNSMGKLKAGAATNAPTFEIDVFEKRGGKWLIVSHVARFSQ